VAGQRRQRTELERAYCPRLFAEEVRHLLGGVIQHATVEHHSTLVFRQATERVGYSSPALSRRDNGEWIVFIVGRVWFRRWRDLALDTSTYVLTPKVLRDLAASDA